MWADEQNKKPIECTAREYCTRLFAWLEHKFEDNTLFPTTGDFPKHFAQEVQVMLKRMVSWLPRDPPPLTPLSCACMHTCTTGTRRRFDSSTQRRT